jgi:hypothetical protein
VRLEERPASLAAALEADVARLDGEVKQLTGNVASGRQQLAKEEDLARRFAEEELEVAIDHVRKGVATVPQQLLVSKAGRWPEPER